MIALLLASFPEIGCAKPGKGCGENANGSASARAKNAHSLAIGKTLEDLAAIEEGLRQLGAPAPAAGDLTDERHKREGSAAAFGPVGLPQPKCQL